jgi:hypothetical protein
VPPPGAVQGCGGGVGAPGAMAGRRPVPTLRGCALMPKSKCATKWKPAMTQAAAEKHALNLRRMPTGRNQYAYRCPEGHWHVGDRTKFQPGAKGKRRRK